MHTAIRLTTYALTLAFISITSGYGAEQKMGIRQPLLAPHKKAATDARKKIASSGLAPIEEAPTPPAPSLVKIAASLTPPASALTSSDTTTPTTANLSAVAARATVAVIHAPLLAPAGLPVRQGSAPSTPTSPAQLCPPLSVQKAAVAAPAPPEVSPLALHSARASDMEPTAPLLPPSSPKTPGILARLLSSTTTRAAVPTAEQSIPLL